MNPRLFLKAAVSLMLIPSLTCLFLPDTIVPRYTKLMLPLILLTGAVLSLRVSAIYQKWLQKAFVFLACFLVLEMVANILVARIEPLWSILLLKVGALFPLLALFMQWTTYAMLVLSSFYILKVTKVRQISIKGRIVILAILGIGVIIMLYHIPPLLEGAIPYMYKIYLPLIIFMDIAIVIMLMPVMLLYAQQMKSERRESITFITIICGIILSRIAAYVYAIVFSISLFEVPSALHTGSILDVLYLFGYLIIAVGLYVHAKYDDWGFQQIEKALEAI